tara:strand:- start:988 stop:1266 length:279 start_codon:yes stop_codon:yes gene_type:complete
MIQENNEPQDTEEPKPDPNKTFYSNDLLKTFYIVLQQIGGVCATRQLLDQVPEDYLDKIICGYDENMKALRIEVKKDRKRGIITPGKKIITN